jgi:hypothetical protein
MTGSNAATAIKAIAYTVQARRSSREKFSGSGETRPLNTVSVVRMVRGKGKRKLEMGAWNGTGASKRLLGD